MFFGQIKWRFAFCGKCEASVKLMRGGILYRLNTRTNYIRMNILRFTLNQLCSVLMNGWLGLYETTVYYGSEYTANPIDSIDGGTSTQPFLIGVLHARCIWTKWIFDSLFSKWPSPPMKACAVLPPIQSDANLGVMLTTDKVENIRQRHVLWFLALFSMSFA